MIDELAPYLRFTAPSASGPREVELRLARVRDVAPLLRDERSAFVDQTQWRARNLSTLLLLFVHRLDGEAFLYDRVGDVLADAELVREITVRIRTLLETFRERGKVFVLCPGCKTWEAEMTFTGYALTIAEPLPSTFDGTSLNLISLGDRAMRSWGRPPLRRAAQIRFDLPSAVMGVQRETVGGVLGQLDYQDNEDRPPRPPRDSDNDNDNDDQEVHDFDELPMVWGAAAWRALTRLSAAIQPPVSVEALTWLPAFDFFFLELLYYVTAIAKVKPDTAGRLTCPTCGTVFLPVREDWKAPR